MISPDSELTPPQKLSSNPLYRSGPEAEPGTSTVLLQEFDVAISAEIGRPDVFWIIVAVKSIAIDIYGTKRPFAAGAGGDHVLAGNGETSLNWSSNMTAQ